MTARVLQLVSVIALGLALAVPCATDAQQPAKMTRLGYFAPSRIPHLLDALKDALRELGYVEGQNLEIEYRFAEGQPETFDELAAELVGLSPDAIVTFATPPTMAVKRATATIPIIMAGTGDPVRAGAVASLARPGGNVTGVTVYAPELSSKRLELLKQAVRKSHALPCSATRETLTIGTCGGTRSLRAGRSGSICGWSWWTSSAIWPRLFRI